MLKLALVCSVISVAMATVFMTEIADPNGSGADARRFVELYSPDGQDISDYVLSIYTNGNTDPGASLTFTSGTTISAGGFFIICKDSTAFSSFWPSATCDLESSSVINSNGDDVYVLTDGTNTIDAFGAVGTDGTGTNWEYEDGRGERRCDITSGSVTFDVAHWDIDGDNGNGAGAVTDAAGFDPGAWIGVSGCPVPQPPTPPPSPPSPPLPSQPPLPPILLMDDFSIDGPLCGSSDGQSSALSPDVGGVWSKPSHGTQGQVVASSGAITLTDSNSEDPYALFAGNAVVTEGTVFYGFDISVADPGSYSGTDFECAPRARAPRLLSSATAVPTKILHALLSV